MNAQNPEAKQHSAATTHPARTFTTNVDERLLKYPRINLRCGNCGNEFCINVLRFTQEESVQCQVCSATFPKQLGEEFAEALKGLYKVKYELNKQKKSFHMAFLYKTTHKQPPAPYPFDARDFADELLDE